jgi:hypothetical protein
MRGASEKVLVEALLLASTRKRDGSKGPLA